MNEFAAFASARSGLDLTNGYAPLWRWSVDDLDGFWSAIWDFFGLPPRPNGPALALEALPGAVWFPGATLNLTSEVFRGRRSDDVALIAAAEDGTRTTLTWGELEHEVAAAAAGLANLGVGCDDRVVGYLPNGAEAVVAFLAAASLGATWAICGLDYAPAAAVARLAQLHPKVLITATEHRYAGRRVDDRDKVGDLAVALPDLSAVVLVGDVTAIRGAISWDQLVTNREAELKPVPVTFTHPLWVLFSSGTTGKPKGIVHGHGGVVLEHLKLNALHLDLGMDDRMLWYTTPSWMMWNALVGCLLSGAAIVCFDGNPAHPQVDSLWELAADLEVTLLGTSPAYLGACRKATVELHRHDLRRLRKVGVTGSAFPADAFNWLTGQLPDGVQISSTSGGTDVVTAFVGSAPLLPVWPGELSGPLLGVALDAFDAAGQSVRAEVGELVITRPMPSMPLHFWNDLDGVRLRETYFSTYPGVWRHGDWVTITDRDSVVIHGRSDATLNRRGIRLGSADIYAATEALAGVAETLVVGIEEPNGGYWMPMFVITTGGVPLDDTLRDQIRQAILTQTSPRHLPDDILQVPMIPHTRTGKKLEVPVKRILSGLPPDQVVDLDSVDDPSSLVWFLKLGQLRIAQQC